MLAEVTGILREHDLLDPADEPHYNITLVTKNVLNLSAFTRGGVFFHKRVKECGALPAEYDSLSNASRLFPRHAPEPLGRYFKNDREIIVLRGISHRPVSARSIASDKHALVRQISGFFEAASVSARVVKPVDSHRAYLRQLQERTTEPACAAIVREWVATERIDDLPHIGQHGDFVLNNLGLTDTGMVVFDWEDFGRITFPGLDLCTVLASDMELNADRLRAMIGGDGALPDNYARLLAKSCPVIGLTPQLFRQLIPLYLVIFLDLKKDYGTAIYRIVNQLIHDIHG